MAITYSDGQSIESRILELVRGTLDRRSHVALAQEHFGSWPVQYHLTPERSNVVRPFRFDGLSVLELGAGMGAVSRRIAETAKELYVIEGTQSRFDVLSERLRGLTNWSGEAANFQDARCDKPFDVVCAIGVLEYSELYLQPPGGRTPFEYFFDLAKRFLKPDGVLLLAIENKLGLKYWSGSAEDHTGRLFDGVCGYSSTPSQRTFSRKELGELFTNAGFVDTRQYFPFPDYKLPTSLLSEAFIDRAPNVAVELATQQAFTNGGLPNAKFFSDLLALESVTKAGLFKEFSNSLIFVGAQQSDSPTLRRVLPEGLAWHYSLRRRLPIQTVFRDVAGELRVDKTALTDPGLTRAEFEGAHRENYLWKALHAEPVFHQTTLRRELLRDAYFGHWTAFHDRLSRFFDETIAECGEHGDLNAHAVDRIFTNVAVTEDGLKVFDEEWGGREPIPVSWFVYRNLFQLGREKTALGGCGFATLADFYTHQCTRLGVKPDLESDHAREARFQAAVSDQPDARRFLPVLREVFSSPLGEDTYARSPHTEAARRGQWREPAKPSVVYRAWRKAGRWLQPEARPPGLSAAAEGLALWRLKGSGLEGASLEIQFKGNAAASSRLEFKRRGRGSAYVVTRDLGPVDVAQVRGASGDLQVVALSRWGVARAFGLLVWTRPFHGTEPSLFSSLAAEWRNGARKLRAWRRFAKELFHSRLVSKVDRYSTWVAMYDTPSRADRERAVARIADGKQPLISVVVPTYNSPEAWLRRALDSVLAQWYPNWELCIADDASTEPHVRRVLEEYAAGDSRVRVVYRKKNGHISAASNSALDLAQGEYVALLDHDDELTPDALLAVVEALQQNPQARLLYSDEDKIDENDKRFSPHFKPDWNPELFYSINLITHLCVMEKKLIDEIGGFRVGYEGSQDYDLMLRAVEKLTSDAIHHIPHILYHWRAIPGSVALDPGEKDYAHARARLAIASHLDRKGVPAQVTPGNYPFFHRVRHTLPETLPKVSAILCTRDRKDLLQVAVKGLLEGTDYPNLDLWIVDNRSTEPTTLAYLETLTSDPRVHVLKYDQEFNYSEMNNLAARQADGEFVLFLNNDIEVLESDWLKELVAQGLQEGVGAVGAKLLYPDGSVQHAGILLGKGGIADHSHRGLARSAPGYFGRALMTLSVSAVTGACMLTRRSLFESLGGFDAVELPIAYNDVDYCLRLRKNGYRVVWTPFAELTHHESATRGADTDGAKRARLEKESQVVRRRWAALLEKDPAYNPNLSLDDDFTLAFPPRATKPWFQGPRVS